MAQYELTAKGNIYLGSGQLIHKGDVFTITLTSPGADANRMAPFLASNQASVLKQISNVYNIELPPQKINMSAFYATRIK